MTDQDGSPISQKEIIVIIKNFRKNTGSDETVVIPDGIIEIGSWAFMDCISLINITIPDSVNTIKYSAFSGYTNLKNVTIPDGVRKIDKTAA